MAETDFTILEFVRGFNNLKKYYQHLINYLRSQDVIVWSTQRGGGSDFSEGRT